MATGVLYVRIDEDLLEWVREQSGSTGVPVAKVTGALLAWARERGARVTGGVAVLAAVCQDTSHDDYGRTGCAECARQSAR